MRTGKKKSWIYLSIALSIGNMFLFGNCQLLRLLLLNPIQLAAYSASPLFFSILTHMTICNSARSLRLIDLLQSDPNYAYTCGVVQCTSYTRTWTHWTEQVMEITRTGEKYNDRSSLLFSIHNAAHTVHSYFYHVYNMHAPPHHQHCNVATNSSFDQLIYSMVLCYNCINRLPYTLHCMLYLWRYA